MIACAGPLEQSGCVWPHCMCNPNKWDRPGEKRWLKPWERRRTKWGKWATVETSLKNLAKEVNIMATDDWTLQLSGTFGDLMVNKRGDDDDVKTYFVDTLGYSEEEYTALQRGPFDAILKDLGFKKSKSKSKKEKDEDDDDDDNEEEEDDDEPTKSLLAKGKKLEIKGYKKMSASELKKAVDKKLKKKSSKKDDDDDD